MRDWNGYVRAGGMRPGGLNWMPVSVSEVDFSLLVLLIAMAVRPQC